MSLGMAERARPDTVSVTPAQLRRAFAHYPTGVVAVCALDEHGNPVGIAASSFVSVSLDPPLVSICVSRSSSTWPVLSLRPRLGLSVFAADKEIACRRLSGPANRFAGAAWRGSESGAVFLEGSPLTLEVCPEQTHPAGDHTIVVLRVLEIATVDRPPLLFHAGRLRPLPT